MGGDFRWRLLQTDMGRRVRKKRFMLVPRVRKKGEVH